MLVREKFKKVEINCDIETFSIYIADGQGDCMEIVISHCEKLSKIHEIALRHLDVCNVCIQCS